MLASVGFVKEEGLNIVPLKIGEIDGSSDIYDLAVMYTRSPDVAEDICNHLGSCFQQVYREAMSTPDHNESRGKSLLWHPIRVEFLCVTNARSCWTLSACLTHEELNKFAVLMKRWRAKEMPILEFAQKLMELYGVERKHLLARMKSLLRGVSKDDLEALNNFLQANGVTENAADSSPLLTGDMSLTTTDSNSPVLDNISTVTTAFAKLASKRDSNTTWEEEVAAAKLGKLSMSNSTAGTRPATGGTGIRNFFSKLRKPSDNLAIANTQ
ncbi:hypothetical protein AAVH_32268, partial [Aphelenchoides avenae]